MATVKRRRKDGEIDGRHNVLGTKPYRFQPGQSGNPAGRPKVPSDVIQMCREQTPAAIKRLTKILNDPASPPSATVRAAEVLLDRAWGSAPQTVRLEGDIVHRKVIELIDRPKLIDVEVVE